MYVCINACYFLYAPGPVHSFPDCIVISAAVASRDTLLSLPLSHNTVFLAVSTSHSAVVTGCLPSLLGQGPSPASRPSGFRHRRSTTPFGPRLRQHSPQQLVRRRHSSTAVVGPSELRSWHGGAKSERGRTGVGLTSLATPCYRRPFHHHPEVALSRVALPPRATWRSLGTSPLPCPRLSHHLLHTCGAANAASLWRPDTAAAQDLPGDLRGPSTDHHCGSWLQPCLAVTSCLTQSNLVALCEVTPPLSAHGEGEIM